MGRAGAKLPNALIVGAPKCGTTSLADALRAHPDVFVPRKKELSFFHSDQNYARGIDWYRSFFLDSSTQVVRLEATPDYFASEKARDRIRQDLPGCRLIFLVRDPVERAHSHFWFRARGGRESRSLSTAVQEELHDPFDEQGYLLKHGFYATHLAGYQAAFDASQLLVLRLEELVTSPGPTLRRVQSFLQIAPRSLPLPKSNAAAAPRSTTVRNLTHRMVVNQGLLKTLLRVVFPDHARARARAMITRLNSRPTKKPDLDDRTRDLLVTTYAADTERLESLLGANLDHWRSRSHRGVQH